MRRERGGMAGVQGLALVVLLFLAVRPAQAQAVVAESQASGEESVAALQARLDWRRRYALQIDGPVGSPFTVRYMQVYVSHQPASGGTGNDDGSLEAVTPYEVDVLAPATQLLFWRYSAVVSSDVPGHLTVRLLDRGLR